MIFSKTFRYTANSVILRCFGAILFSLCIACTEQLLSQKFHLTYFIIITVKTFLSTFPLLLFFRKKMFFTTPLPALLLILYYLLFSPSIAVFIGITTTKETFLIRLLSAFDIVVLFTAHCFAGKYLIVDLFRQRHPITSQDILYLGISYITIALTFALLYALLSFTSVTPQFTGLQYQFFTFASYWEHIYFSFITIATVGYGDITPLTPIARMLVILEILTGIFLVNVLLALVLSSGILNNKHHTMHK